MKEIALMHRVDSEYCCPLSKNTIEIRLRTAKNDVSHVYIIYGGKYSFAENKNRQEMIRRYSDGLYDYFTVILKLEDLRLVYIFEILCGKKIFFYSEDGLNSNYDFKLNYYNAFQVAYINDADVHYEVEWMRSARFYQIFIDRFDCGNDTKDKSYINLVWGEIPNSKSFAGGDLKGIVRRLDYLIDLGINTIYLTPIFQSVSNHKYDIKDYYKIDSQFGGVEDFEELIAEAKRRNIKIVMDAVFNHVSSDCIQFQDVILKGKSSEYYDWFIINGDVIDMKNVNYECFASCNYMPKWNTSNEKVQKFLIDIALYWILRYDIDGWRLDVSDEVSHNFWRMFRKAIKREKKDCVIIGENWHNANSYLRGDQYDSIMNYAFTKACLDFFAFNKFTAKEFAEKLIELLMRNTYPVNNMMLNLLDSHDTDRFITRVGGDKEKLKCALAILYMYLGAPCIYYGTEIGLEGGYDPDCRRTMDWDKAEKNGELKTLIKTLAKLKKDEILINGEIKIYADEELFRLERSYKGKTLRLTVNESKKIYPLDGNIILASSENNQKKLGCGQFVIERM